MLDIDLAILYEVEVRSLNQAVKRNLERFPDDFMFQLTDEETEFLRSQNVISSLEGHGGRGTAPYAFTEQGWRCYRASCTANVPSGSTLRS